jgi:pimeloyl-ACP methyl ester carboxylesterase
MGFGSVAGVNYPPLGGDALSKARRLAREVDRVLTRTGASRVDLVAHSLGGIVARLYVRELGGARHVRRLVTLGTPHQGTRVAALAPDPLARSLQPGSRLLRDLGRDDPVPALVSVTSIFSTFDAKILPARSAVYAGALNVEVDGIGHDAMLFSPKIAVLVSEALGAPSGFGSAPSDP